MSHKPIINNNQTSSIGIVGGGQLAQMLVKAAIERNLKTTVQTATKIDPAAILADSVVLFEADDIEGTRELSKISKRITFENEWVNIDGLSILEKEGVEFLPSLEAISPLINKLSQRKLLKNLNIPVADWLPITSQLIDSSNLPSHWDFPIMAKRSKGGYDGKGTKVIKDKDALIAFFKSINSDEWFIEKWVNYEKEISIIASRDIEGYIRYFPIVETFQSKQVCDWVLAPAEVNHSVELMAYNIAASLLRELNYIGVLTIELFYGDDGLIVNEIAPRTHNSAHFSIEACNTSQFDQQVCITAGLPVPSIKLNYQGALMINLLGLSNGAEDSLNDRLKQLNQIPGANLHWYEKEERLGRKVGHVTFLLDEVNSLRRRNQALTLLKKIRSIWPNPKPI